MLHTRCKSQLLTMFPKDCHSNVLHEDENAVSHENASPREASTDKRLFHLCRAQMCSMIVYLRHMDVKCPLHRRLPRQNVVKLRDSKSTKHNSNSSGNSSNNITTDRQETEAAAAATATPPPPLPSLTTTASVVQATPLAATTAAAAAESRYV